MSNIVPPADKPKMPTSIAMGLVKAQAYARGVEKLGKNTQGKGYQYATAEDVIAEGRKSLLEGGRLAFVVTGWSFAPSENTGPAKTKVGDDGKTKTLATAIGRITVRYVLASEAGEVYEDETSAPVVPEFGRPDDKAEYGALTEGHAYTLRGLLNLPRGVEGAVNMNQRNDDAPADDAPPADQPAARTPPPAQDGWAARAAAASDRPRTDVTREEARAAADAAVEAQVGPGAAHPPLEATGVDDKPLLALSLELTKEANETKDPVGVFEKIRASGLPRHLKMAPYRIAVLRGLLIAGDTASVREWHGILDRMGFAPEVRNEVFAAAFVAAAEVAKDADELDSWLPAMTAEKLTGTPKDAAVKAFNAAAARTGWKPSPKAA